MVVMKLGCYAVFGHSHSRARLSKPTATIIGKSAWTDPLLSYIGLVYGAYLSGNR